MPRETGTVVQIEGAQARVSFVRSSACAKCGACSRGQSDQEMLLTVDNALRARIGEQVQVSIEARSLLLSSALVYMVPLVFLFVGVVAGIAAARALGVTEPDVVGAIAGLFLAALSFGALRLLEPRFKQNARFYPKIVAVVEPDQTGTYKEDI